MESPRYYSHVLIIGSGLAGCSAALTLADQGCEVSLLTPLESLDGGNSERAQGRSARLGKGYVYRRASLQFW